MLTQVSEERYRRVKPSQWSKLGDECRQASNPLSRSSASQPSFTNLQQALNLSHWVIDMQIECKVNRVNTAYTKY
ncbi:MAG: hypothetical protein P8L39_16890, partial [Halioglobus sp.]|nr:hypothetical protein [Halioglobus sp.]